MLTFIVINPQVMNLQVVLIINFFPYSLFGIWLHYILRGVGLNALQLHVICEEAAWS